MHSPITVKELKEILKKVDNKKEVIIEIGFNEYDIFTWCQKDDNFKIYVKHSSLRDEPDEPKKRI